MDENLPVTVVTYSLPEEERACSCCGNSAHVMKTETYRTLDIIPAKIFVTEHRCEVYSCRMCEREGTETPIFKAPMPKQPLPKTMASPSVLAYVLVQKYLDSLPLYRQSGQFEQLGAFISRQTMSNWVIGATEKWLAPIYERMREFLLTQQVLHADETSLQVLREEGRSASSKSYVWLYRTGRSGPACVLYDYHTTRSSQHPCEFLGGFEGTLHVDGYPGYNSLKGVTLSCCWAHARRKFIDAGRSSPKKSGGPPTLTDQAIARIGAIYKVEEKIREAEERSKKHDPETRLKIRKEKSLPLVQAFFAWLKTIQNEVLPKSHLGKAIAYSLNLEEKLMQPFRDGRLDIDNNLAERTIKPFVIGRKNWLFSNTPEGARASVIAYSLVVTAKENGLNVLKYLEHLFSTLPNLDLNNHAELDRLLPWSKDLPAECRLPKDDN